MSVRRRPHGPSHKEQQEERADIVRVASLQPLLKPLARKRLFKCFVHTYSGTNDGVQALVTLLDLSVPPIMRMTGARQPGPRSDQGEKAAMAKGSAVCVCV